MARQPDFNRGQQVGFPFKRPFPVRQRIRPPAANFALPATFGRCEVLHGVMGAVGLALKDTRVPSAAEPLYYTIRADRFHIARL